MSAWQAPPALVEAASELFRPAGRFARQFARMKLGADPAFAAILALDLLAQRRRILDLGCGQGLLVAWLAAARHCARRGQWPRDWPPPPEAAAIRGIELRARDVARARCALAANADPQVRFELADIRNASFGSADAVVILDVLHYIDYAAQVEIVRRMREALVPGGVLITRVGDAAGGWPFRFSQLMDRFVLLLRGDGWSRLYCRPVAAWCELLEQQGFRVETVPMNTGTPFANVMLIAHLS